MLAVLHEPGFADLAPAEVYARLLDEGRYLCSERTMSRILAETAEVRERREQLRHPEYKKPELLATAPNQVWSWYMTKLLGPQKWTYFYLYVLLDIFSRYVVGWLVASRESAALARKLIGESCTRQNIQPQQLTIHADRGPSMTSKSLALLLADLGATKSHSRPNVSDDNPFSEAQFKTLKYRPDFPERFGSIEHARAHSLRGMHTSFSRARGATAADVVAMLGHRSYSTTQRHYIASGVDEARNASVVQDLLLGAVPGPEGPGTAGDLDDNNADPRYDKTPGFAGGSGVRGGGIEPPWLLTASTSS